MESCSNANPFLLSPAIKEAFGYAFDLHARQYRKGTDVPYLSHLMGVASLTLESGGDEREVIAALLHDAVEDQGGLETLREIQRRFGEPVALLVEGCTDSSDQPKPPWQQRKAVYVSRMAEAPLSVRRISICDKLHNVRCTVQEYRQEGEALWDKFSGKRQLIDWYYPALLQAYRVQPLPGRLSAFVEEIEGLVRVLQAACGSTLQGAAQEGAPLKKDNTA